MLKSCKGISTRLVVLSLIFIVGIFILFVFLLGKGNENITITKDLITQTLKEEYWPEAFEPKILGWWHSEKETGIIIDNVYLLSWKKGNVDFDLYLSTKSSERKESVSEGGQKFDDIEIKFFLPKDDEWYDKDLLDIETREKFLPAVSKYLKDFLHDIKPEWSNELYTICYENGFEKELLLTWKGYVFVKWSKSDEKGEKCSHPSLENLPCGTFKFC